MSKKNLGKLVQQSSKLVTSISAGGQFPPLRRNPDQLFEQSQRLAKKQPVDEKAQTQAQVLFAKTGFESDRLVDKLNAIDLRATYEPLEPIHETDLEAFLNHEHEMLILTAIEEAKKTTVERFNASCRDHMNNEWENEKRGLMEYFSQASSIREPSRRSRFPIDMDKMDASFPTSPAPAAAAIGIQSKLSRKQIEYGKEVRELNEHRVAGRNCQVMSLFSKASHAFNERDIAKSTGLENTWRILATIAQEGRDAGPAEGAYAMQLRDVGQKQELVNHARIALEEQYWDYMQNKVRQRLSTATLGGRMSKISYCRAFVKEIVPKDHLELNYFELDTSGSEEVPAWGVLYYCLRCGDVNAAKEYATYTKVLQSFVPFIALYIDGNRKVPTDQKIHMRNEYTKIIRQGKDYYKQLVYNLVGKLDTARSHNDIPMWSADDWMWLKLNMVHVDKVGDKIDKTVLTLSQLQATLRQYGRAHFKSDLLYFQLLLLTLQFEYAIKFLENVPEFAVETVHFAIALYYYGLVRLPDQPTHQLFIDDEKGEPKLNIVRLLKNYIQPFQQTDPDVALHYLYLIQNDIARVAAIKDLILETEEYGALVGQVEADGTRRAGLLDRFLKDPNMRNEILVQAATVCEDSGRYDEAIRLFDMASMYDRVLVLLSKLLGRVLTVQSPERTKIVELAHFVRSKTQRDLADPTQYQKFHRQVSKDHENSFKMLLRLIAFFDAYWAGNAYKAVAEIESDECSIVPLDTQGIDAAVLKFKTLFESIRRNFAEILLALMHCYVRLNADVSQRFNGAENSRIWKEKAKALVQFAGCIQFRMAPDWHAQIVRLEVALTDR